MIMGCCSSRVSCGANSTENTNEKKPQPRTNKDRPQANDHVTNPSGESVERRTIKLQLFGAGGSGKSTIFKQLEKIYKTDIQQYTLNNCTDYIRQVL